MEIPISIPLDPSGFLRRECPTCQGEFKWFAGATEGRPDDFLEPENYFCPYCGTPAGHDSWWTPAQIEYAQGLAIGPIGSWLEDEMKHAFKGQIKLERTNHEVPDLLVDPDDMIMIEPPCHPFEPLKVLDDRLADPVHCLMCGAKFRL